ncbi:MAG: glucose-6-phosphate dehydrogenase assembly protein OpcA [Candidatus Methylomirabilales bacterium]
MGWEHESPDAMSTNAQQIEHDLQQLWKQMAESADGEGQQPVMRVCVLNVIAYAPGEQGNGEVGEIMAEVTIQHPSRIIVVLSNSEATGPRLDAWVTAQCHLAAGARKQICCEQIKIAAEGEGVSQVPSMIRSLLVHDLPVVLWWRDIPRCESRLFGELLKTSDRVIIDSERFPDAERGLAGLRTLIGQTAERTAFSDLSWSRLTPWRASVAGLFDAPEWRAYLRRLSRVEIRYRQDDAERCSIPSQALLIACWLASRLGWRPTSVSRQNDNQTLWCEFVSATVPITLQVTVVPATQGAHVGLSALTLIAEDGPPVRFGVSRSADGAYLRSDVEVAGKRLPGNVFRLGGQTEAELISTELEMLGRDALYEQALEFLSGLRMVK